MQTVSNSSFVVIHQVNTRGKVHRNLRLTEQGHFVPDNILSSRTVKPSFDLKSTFQQHSIFIDGIERRKYRFA